ncbi:MAG: ribonuclease R [Gammaproteobacteria bacterium]|nr:ribonuclease R [Gammaproteobacteria bacterium]
MARKKPSDIDPHFEREAAKYDKPIPSREVILKFLEDCGKLMVFEKIAGALGLWDEDDLVALQRRLRAMERDGQILCNRRGGYGLVQRLDLIKGRVEGHRDGFGFVIPEAGGGDVFVSAREMRKVLHGDKVLVSVTGLDRRGRREGAIVEVLEPGFTQFVGRFREEQGIAYVIPDDRRITAEILIPKEHAGQAKAGQMVVVQIVARPTPISQPLGKITEILGEHMAPGMEIEVALRSHELPHTWSQLVLDEIASLKPEVAEADKKGRIDLRQLPLVTIDGEDARDFDDAVYCEAKKSGGWRLWVAIADVSHYVRPGTELDAEALRRGNSVYFPGSVIPMLPEILSNGLCSLNPAVDRLCMVAEMTVSAAGRLSGHTMYPALMRSQARLTYTQVWDWLSGAKPVPAEREFLMPHLRELHALYQALHGARVERGGIEFETVETRIQFNEQRKIERIVPVVRNDAHRLIEECMILANVAAAKTILKAEKPGVFRIHEGGRAQKLENFREFLAELGLNLGGGEEPGPKDYAKLLSQVVGRPDAELIQTMMLRSLKQAVYSPDNIGHFGLALPAYSHFTSPIRRYPDLLAHRIIKHALEVQGGKMAGLDSGVVYDMAHMLSYGEQCSMTERRADDATRDVSDWLKCEYMQDKLGEEFDGVVSTVTAFGVFVRLSEIYVEGLVHITALNNDYYHFDPVKARLKGERTGEVFRIGDQVRIRVTRVDLDERKIDFDLVAKTATGKKARSGVETVWDKPVERKPGGRKPKGEGKKPPAGKKSGARKPAGKKPAAGKPAGKKPARGPKKK